MLAESQEHEREHGKAPEEEGKRQKRAPSLVQPHTRAAPGCVLWRGTGAQPPLKPVAGVRSRRCRLPKCIPEVCLKTSPTSYS